jgi:hypothetical protein
MDISIIYHCDYRKPQCKALKALEFFGRARGNNQMRHRIMAMQPGDPWRRMIGLEEAVRRTQGRRS